jgi:hypothetical protein
MSQAEQDLGCLHVHLLGPRLCLPLAAGMSQVEQDLGCLHVDLVTLLGRVELKLGLQEQSCRASAKQAGMMAASQKRDAQVCTLAASQIRCMRAASHA